VEFLAASGPVAVLDGGSATELEARGHDLGDALWSARMLVDDPDAIVAAPTGAAAGSPRRAEATLAAATPPALPLRPRPTAA